MQDLVGKKEIPLIHVTRGCLDSLFHESGSTDTITLHAEIHQEPNHHQTDTNSNQLKKDEKTESLTPDHMSKLKESETIEINPMTRDAITDLATTVSTVLQMLPSNKPHLVSDAVGNGSSSVPFKCDDYSEHKHISVKPKNEVSSFKIVDQGTKNSNVKTSLSTNRKQVYDSDSDKTLSSGHIDEGDGKDFDNTSNNNSLYCSGSEGSSYFTPMCSPAKSGTNHMKQIKYYLAEAHDNSIVKEDDVTIVSENSETESTKELMTYDLDSNNSMVDNQASQYLPLQRFLRMDGSTKDNQSNFIPLNVISSTKIPSQGSPSKNIQSKNIPSKDIPSKENLSGIDKSIKSPHNTPLSSLESSPESSSNTPPIKSPTSFPAKQTTVTNHPAQSHGSTMISNSPSSSSIASCDSVPEESLRERDIPAPVTIPQQEEKQIFCTSL